mmetsp:Transcript_4905/g.6751  ORF Transcript_4905/g.6751 Transcript_4905/m.6751 type:complete len:81 (+) Transcript_4905:104-346(+)
MQQKHARTQLSVMVQQVVTRTIDRKIRSNVVYIAKTKISSRCLSHGQFKYKDCVQVWSGAGTSYHTVGGPVALYSQTLKS